MAEGTHWEWRAFGHPGDELLSRLQQLENHFGPMNTGIEHTDEYLWSGARVANVKLRDAELKFKHPLAVDGDCELWAENPGDSFGFPLNDNAEAMLRRELCVLSPDEKTSWRTSDQSLRESLHLFIPKVELVSVQKYRIQYDLTLDDETLIVELGRISHPVSIWTIGIEGRALDCDDAGDPDKQQAASSLARVQQATRELPLEGLVPGGYLEKLGQWARLGD